MNHQSHTHLSLLYSIAVLRLVKRILVLVNRLPQSVVPTVSASPFSRYLCWPVAQGNHRLSSFLDSLRFWRSRSWLLVWVATLYYPLDDSVAYTADVNRTARFWIIVFFVKASCTQIILTLFPKWSFALHCGIDFAR